MTRNKMMVVAAVTGVLAVSGAAQGYIATADALMARATGSRVRLGVRTLVLRGTLDRQGDRRQVYEAIKADARRRELTVGETTQVILDIAGQRYAFQKGVASGPARPAPLDVLSALGFPAEDDKDGSRGVALLQQLGIDPSVVSLGRQGRRIVFVIGAQANERNKPQLWLDKTLLVPTRLVLLDRSGSRTETRWLGFESELTEPFFPRRIETWVDGRLVESVTYNAIDVNPRVDPALFEPPV